MTLKKSSANRSQGNRKKMNTLEFILMLIIWQKILNRVNATSKSLQKIENNLTVAVDLYNSLIEFIKDLRDKFDEIENKAKEISETTTYKESRIKKHKKFHDEGQSEEILFNAKKTLL